MLEPGVQLDLSQGLVSLCWFLGHHFLNEVIDEISIVVLIIVREGYSVSHYALIHQIHVTVVERRKACQHLKQKGT